MYCSGLIGPYKDYIISMNHMTMLKQSNELFISANSKRHKVEQLPGLEEIYPSVSKWMMMGQETPKEDYAVKAARSMIDMSDGNVPQWLIEATKEE